MERRTAPPTCNADDRAGRWRPAWARRKAPVQRAADLCRVRSAVRGRGLPELRLLQSRQRWQCRVPEQRAGEADVVEREVLAG